MADGTKDRWSHEDMVLLADLVMDEQCTGNDSDLEDVVRGTGWTVWEFGRVCDRRWNGPEWVR